MQEVKERTPDPLLWPSTASMSWSVSLPASAGAAPAANEAIEVCSCEPVLKR